jgi:hypothetical protein
VTVVGLVDGGHILDFKCRNSTPDLIVIIETKKKAIKLIQPNLNLSSPWFSKSGGRGFGLIPEHPAYRSPYLCFSSL